MLIMFSDSLVRQEQPFHQPHLCSLTDQKSLFLTHTTCALLIGKGIFLILEPKLKKQPNYFFFFNFGRHCAKRIGALADLTPTIKCSNLEVSCVVSPSMYCSELFLCSLQSQRGQKVQFYHGPRSWENWNYLPSSTSDCHCPSGRYKVNRLLTF